MMMSLSNFHALAATRGEGLHPELRSLFDCNPEKAELELALRTGGVVHPMPGSRTSGVSEKRGSGGEAD